LRHPRRADRGRASLCALPEHGYRVRHHELSDRLSNSPRRSIPVCSRRRVLRFLAARCGAAGAVVSNRPAANPLRASSAPRAEPHVRAVLTLSPDDSSSAPGSSWPRAHVRHLPVCRPPASAGSRDHRDLLGTTPNRTCTRRAHSVRLLASSPHDVMTRIPRRPTASPQPSQGALDRLQDGALRSSSRTGGWSHPHVRRLAAGRRST